VIACFDQTIVANIMTKFASLKPNDDGLEGISVDETGGNVTFEDGSAILVRSCQDIETGITGSLLHDMQVVEFHTDHRTGIISNALARLALHRAKYEGKANGEGATLTKKERVKLTPSKGKDHDNKARGARL
jgi:hypothetical protein